MNNYKAALYARISIADENDSNDSSSIINQKEFMLKYASNNDISVVDFYVDDGYSGGNFERPGFKRMLADIENGYINCVITKDTSRLGRDFINTGYYIYKYFPENNVRYIAILDNYDSNLPSLSDDIIPFKTVLNDMYLKDISRKITSARHELMKKGYFLGSKVPYGYRRSSVDSRILEIDCEAAFVVKRIFDMRILGFNISSIVEFLNREGILSPSGTKWTCSSINYLLKNEVYIGTLTQAKYATVSLKSKKKKKLSSDNWIQIENNHPAIIDRNVFYSINNFKTSTRVSKYNYYFKGLARCSGCGAQMIARRIKKGDGAYPIYCCKTYAKTNGKSCSMHYIKESVLKDVIYNSFIKRVNGIVSLDVIIKAAANDYKETLSCDSVNKKINDYKRLKILANMDFDEGIIDKMQYDSIINDFNSMLELLKLKRNNIKKAKEFLDDYKKIIAWWDLFLENFFVKPSILRILIESISIDIQKIYVNWNFRG